MSNRRHQTKITFESESSLFAGLFRLFTFTGAATPSSTSARDRMKAQVCAVVCGTLALLALATLGPTVASAAPPNFCPSGSSAGKCNLPYAVAVDQSSGHVYLGEWNNNRVSEFDSAGHFQRAFGFGVRDGADELQTCEALCIQGVGSSSPGAVRPAAIAVDPSSHDIYVADEGQRVEKFSSSGEFLLAFGKEVNKTKVAEAAPEGEQNLCTKADIESGDVCGRGAVGSQPATINVGNYLSSSVFSGRALAVDGSGHVWFGDIDRLEEFSAGGEYLSEVPLPGAGTVISLAIDSADNFYAISSGVAGIQKLEPDGTPFASPYPLDAAGHPNALALDQATGNLYVSDQLEPNFTSNYGKATLLSYNSAGTQTAAFGSGEVIGSPQGNALAFGDTAQRLYVASSAGQEDSAGQAFTLPPPGPLPGTGTTKATEIKKTAATFCAKVNPEGKSTTVHFQYIAEAEYLADGEEFDTGAQQTPESAPIGSDFSPHEVCQSVSSLQPATSYRVRLVATNADAPAGNDGETVAFATLPPAAIDSTSVSQVTADSATFEAEINPLGDATSYRFEYLTEAAYLQNEAEELPPFTGAALAPLQDAPIGAGSQDVSVSQHVQGLQPATVYRYRAVVRNVVSEAHGGPFGGPALAFTTQSFGTAGLPDDRAWELVSPPDKRGALLKPIIREGVIQASADGNAIAYLATAPTEANPAGYTNLVQVLSTRGASWASRNIAGPHSVETGASIGQGQEYRFFSEDLSLAILQPFGVFEPSLSPQASEQTAFLRTNFPTGDPTALCGSSCYRPLVSGCPEVGEPCPPAVEEVADVPAGTKFGGKLGGDEVCTVIFCGPIFAGAAPDLHHVLLEYATALTATPGDEGGLYEWSADSPPAEALRRVGVLPNGESAIAPALGGQAGNTRSAISTDGSRIVFEAGKFGGSRHLYLRYNATEPQSPIAAGECTEPQKACTVQLDALRGGPGGSQQSGPHFQFASTDGSRVFFTDSQQLTPNSGSSQDLYECLMVEEGGALECDLTDLTPESGAGSANVGGLVGGFVGGSSDGSYLYYVNGLSLYLRHDGATKFIATLDESDSSAWSKSARVSPSGRWVAFMSQRPLTGYDNRDAVSGRPDREVFLYDAAAAGGEGRILCASCNPTGARPHGIKDKNEYVAASIPGWSEYRLGGAFHQPRYLSDSGRLFFNSADALVLADTNGTWDVYQYEPPKNVAGAASTNTCATASLTYSPLSQGCVDLISSGTSARESAFLDASESGDDVFFLTTAKLSAKDFDTSSDVYDARVGGGETEPIKPVECSGDACQMPAVPPNDPTPGSLTFNGAGNLTECPKGKVKKNGRCVKQHKPKKHHKKHAKHHKKKGHKKQKRANSTHGGHR